MKRILAWLVATMIVLSSSTALALDIDYSALTDAELDELIREASAEKSSRQVVHVPVPVNASPDKYTWYIQDYVGRNAAGFGYTSLGGNRLERYGAGYLEFVFVTEDGLYLDIEDEEQLQQYIVTGQNIEPNTEMKLVFRTDSNGEEYSNLVDWQSIRYIDLTVKRMDGTMLGEHVALSLIPIEPSPDKYTQYIRNYVGKNLMSFGYTSMGGDRRDRYGAANLRLNLVSDDGSYIDPENKELLSHYVVTSQDVAPNSVMKLSFSKDDEGNEYSNLVDNQTYDSITLYVHKLDIDFTTIATSAHTTEAEAQEATSKAEPTTKPVVADGTIHSYQDVQYKLLDDGTAEICGVTKKESSITIPSEVDGYIVTRIADGAFEDMTEIKSILNWADLTFIGARAFKGCTGLKDFSVPGETTYIGESAFEGCTNLKTVIMWGEPTSIEKNTFKGCTRLSDISIPSSGPTLANRFLKIVRIWTR